ncbi:hypothetical protein [Dactylosporangium matsuzakiense]|nr:hypothetical protein [Dactylosporangium matsuzakiense]UWZ48710.1 hypothetical protein Dmats_21285 [Dactylosporangium matsuzakiense]
MDTFARRLLSALAGLVAATAVSTPAAAYIPLKGYDGNGNVVCNSIKFTSGSVKVVLHTAEYTGTTVNDTAALLQAVKDVDRQIGLTGGTAAKISSTTSTTAPFVYGTPFNDTVPTIHVGFVTSIKEKDAIGQTKQMSISSCAYNEVQIAFLDQSVWGWDVRTPSDTGEALFSAGRNSTAGGTWFRPSYLHELMHAFGLHHTHGSYAFMNYGTRPWANRPAADAIRPLPDDAHGLRDLYPATGTRTEVALLNTWMDSDDTDHGAAQQKELCEPSTGAMIVDSLADPFQHFCGTTYTMPGGPTLGGSATVCVGAGIVTRVAVANYSTEDVQTELHMWFSTDTTWTVTGDVESADSYGRQVDENNSELLAHTFTVPSTLTSGATYRPIAQVDYWLDVDHDGVPDPGTTSYDWIPMRGAVNIC